MERNCGLDAAELFNSLVQAHMPDQLQMLCDPGWAGPVGGQPVGSGERAAGAGAAAGAVAAAGAGAGAALTAAVTAAATAATLVLARRV